jgi:hypothetical protein
VAAAQLARITNDSALEATYRERVHRNLDLLAGSLTDGKLRQRFLRTEAVQKATASE